MVVSHLVYHGTDGPVVVDDMASTLLADKFVLAGQELGFDHVDVTAQKQFGKLRPVSVSECVGSLMRVKCIIMQDSLGGCIKCLILSIQCLRFF